MNLSLYIIYTSFRLPVFAGPPSLRYGGLTSFAHLLRSGYPAQPANHSLLGAAAPKPPLVSGQKCFLTTSHLLCPPGIISFSFWPLGGFAYFYRSSRYGVQPCHSPPFLLILIDPLRLTIFFFSFLAQYSCVSAFLHLPSAMSYFYLSFGEQLLYYYNRCC